LIDLYQPVNWLVSGDFPDPVPVLADCAEVGFGTAPGRHALFQFAAFAAAAIIGVALNNCGLSFAPSGVKIF